MSEYCPWVKIDYRVHALTPAVGHWAFSPSERYLAWVEGPDMRAVQVTELPSMRTVCTLEGADFLALSWADDETLRVVRREREKVVVSRHAVPDGGALGAVSVPRDGLSITVQTSADGRVTLIRSVRYAKPGDAPRAFLVGAAGDDDVTALALLHPRIEIAQDWRATSIDCVQSPDGRVVAALQQKSIPPHDASLWFAAPHTRPSSPTPFSEGSLCLLGWVSPSRVLVSHSLADGGALVAVDRDGALFRAATFATARPIAASLDLHPERDRLLLCASQLGSGRYRTLALCVRLDGAAPEVITLSAGRVLGDGGVRDGGACWDRDGAIVTLTQSPPGVANLMRRPTVAATGARLAHFKLIGERPVDLALAPSPRRERFAMTWKCFDRGPADPVRRLALFSADS